MRSRSQHMFRKPTCLACSSGTLVFDPIRTPAASARLRVGTLGFGRTEGFTGLRIDGPAYWRTCLRVSCGSGGLRNAAICGHCRKAGPGVGRSWVWRGGRGRVFCAAGCRPASPLAAGATDYTGAGGDCAHSALNMVMASESGRSFGIAASAASTTRPGTSSPERIVRRTTSFALAATVAPDGSLGSSYVFPAPLERRGIPYSSISLRMPEEVDPSREAMTTVERRASR